MDRIKGVFVNTEKPSTKRLVHIEFLKIIAMIFVIFNHTADKGFFRFSVAPPSVKQWLLLFLSIGCKVAVPLFYMTSGAVLLGKDEPIRVVYKKRVLKYVLLLFLATFVYWLFACFRQYVLPFEWKVYFTTIYTTNICAQIWYLYRYIAILMMLPLLRRMARAMREADYIYLAAMSLIFTGMIPIAEYILFQGKYTLNEYMQGALFTATYIVFFLMGYYFEHIMPKSRLTKKNVFGMIVLSIAAILFCSYLTLHKGAATGELSEGVSQTFHNSLIAIPAYALYVCAKYVFETVRIPEWVNKGIITVGGTVFGVFLFETIIRDECRKIFVALQPYVKTFPACCIWVLGSFTIGSVIIYILKKIPFIRKII